MSGTESPGDNMDHAVHMRDVMADVREFRKEIKLLHDKLVAGGNLYAIEHERAENAIAVLRRLLRWYESNYIFGISLTRGSGELDDIIDYARRVSQ